MVRRSRAPWLVLATGLVSILAPAGTAQEGPPGLRIAELLPNPDAGQPEFIELWNPTGAAVPLAGWTVADRLATPSNFTLPAWSLPPGGRMVVWSGANATATADGPKWTAIGKWNNDKDGATLMAPDGTVVDFLAYGAWSPEPPPSFSGQPTHAAPPKGRSLALAAGGWGEADPTPGRAPGTAGGGMDVTVENVAPTASFTAPPQRLAPGEAATLRIEAGDPNGAADVAGWSLASGAEALAEGASAGLHDVPATAPAAGWWNLTLTVRDREGLETYATHSIEVRSGGLQVILPPSGRLRFPPLRPGDAEVAALEPFTLRNDGATALRPLFDLSDLRGPAGSFAAAGHVEVGVSSAGGATAWRLYDAPLLELPILEPGAEASVHLRLRDVPVPLAAGAYGSSFTVVAA